MSLREVSDIEELHIKANAEYDACECRILTLIDHALNLLAAEGREDYAKVARKYFYEMFNVVDEE